MTLSQGSMSVAEYTAKFDSLAWFASSLVPTDQARKMKYMHGLNVNVVNHVDSGDVGPRTYANAVQRALHVAGWNGNEKAPASKSAATTPSESADASQGNSLKRAKIQQRWQDRQQQGSGTRSQQSSNNRFQVSSGNL